MKRYIKCYSIYDEEFDNLVDHYNELLRSLHTYQDLQQFVNDMNDEGIGMWFNVLTKSSGQVVDFYADPKDDKYVYYITDQDSRVRKCLISNLYKFWRVHR